MKIETVIFDINGVLLNTTQIDVNFLNKMRGENLTFKELNGEFSVYKKTHTLHFQFKSAQEYDAYQEFYYTNPVINDNAKQVIEILNTMGIKLFTMGGTARNEWEKKGKLITKLFDNKIIPEFSTGPSKAPYLIELAAKYNLDPRKTLFIDDSIASVRQGKAAKFQVARMMGMSTVKSPANLRVPHFTSFEQIQDFIITSR